VTHDLMIMNATKGRFVYYVSFSVYRSISELIGEANRRN